jgi:hypothetical protein
MDYPDYERQQELAHAGDHVVEYMQAIFDEWQPADNTLSSLNRRVYKDTDAGISVGYQLDDGTYVWNGDRRLEDPKLVNRVQAIGFSSIVEGSDAEVGLTWLNLLDENLDSAEKAVEAFQHRVDETNDAACELWEQEHEDEDEYEGAERWEAVK